MFIKNLINYIKIKKIIRKVIKEENLLDNLSALFSSDNYKVNFKQDWIGRIYAVLNPVVQDPQSRIFEYDTNGVNLNSFVEKWIMERMLIADTFVKNHDLFDILIYDIKQIDGDYNFLFTLTPIVWHNFWKSSKIFISVLISLITLATILFIIL